MCHLAHLAAQSYRVRDRHLRHLKQRGENELLSFPPYPKLPGQKTLISKDYRVAEALLGSVPSENFHLPRSVEPT
jgi:hypothetical protein